VLSALPWLAVVGTRQSTPYGQSLTHQLVEGLAGQHLGIVSGMAMGIDTFAHQAALNVGLPTVAFFGCGLNTIYPSSNRQLAQAIVEAGGALISEYPFSLPPHPQLFPQRNRLIAALCQAALVVEAGERSGAMQTARLALDSSRDVFAVPGACHWPQSHGPLSLIRQGATPVWQPQHLQEALGLPPILALTPPREQPAFLSSNLPVPSAVPPMPQPLLKGQPPLKGKAAQKAVQGTKLSTSALTQPAPPPPEVSALPNSPQQQVVLALLNLQTPVLVDELAATTGLSLSELQSTLLLLELEGWVSKPTTMSVQRLK